MQTLDHLAGPGAMLLKIRDWLAPGGLLLLSGLINIAGPAARLFGNRFRLLHPFHLVYFTPMVIRRILAALGFRILSLEYPYFNTPYFTLGSIARLAGGLSRPAGFGRGGSLPYSPAAYGSLMTVLATLEPGS